MVPCIVLAEVKQPLLLTFSGAFRGRILSCSTCPGGGGGGLARRAQYLNENFPNIAPLSLDAGQSLDLDPHQGKQLTLCSFKGLAKVGTKVSLVTVRDLFYGVDFIQSAADSAGITLLNANFIDNDGDFIFPSWGVVKWNGWSIAVAGITDHQVGRRITDYDSRLSE